MSHDRNFDDLAEHFEKKIYGGLKGQIRLAVLRHDIFEFVEARASQLGRPLRILDVGAGLAQLSVELADQGHLLTINDISQNMMDMARSRTTNTTIIWHVCPYQALNDKLSGRYDVILCHALLEWLSEPWRIMDFFDNWLADEGLVSLCFYNPASFVYRNLIMGNFNLLNKDDFKADNGSLTPNHPVPKEEVLQWLTDHNYRVIHTSGLRVFHDYAANKRGGHSNHEAVIEMEIKYSRQEPFKWLGRYLHFVAQK